MGVTRDISENGISLVTFTSLPKNKKISLSLHLNQTVFHCKATVLFTTRKKHIYGEMFISGLKYEDLSEEDTTIIRQHCFNTILPKFQYKFSRKYPVILKKFLKCFKKESFRKHYRQRISLPLVVRNNEKTSIITTTNDISGGGLSFTSYVPVELGTELIMEVSVPTGTLSVKGDVVQMKEIVGGSSFFISIKFVQFYNHSEEGFFNLTSQKSKFS
jgi:cellulose synthase (UDP-forming)